jgi:phosphoribosylformimino-5-aminoimidazole carboxamide ribotide isomerase
LEVETVRIIPVLDLKDGQVVHARKGQRDLYRPIETPLSLTSEAASVAAGLRSLYPFPTFYIADLNAIAGGMPNDEALAALRGTKPQPQLWVDAGLAESGPLAAALEKPWLRPVLGTESQKDAWLLARFAGHPNLILSLDFPGADFHGPAGIFDNVDLWPQTVIVMTLARVGAAGGPDFERLQAIKARAGKRAIIAAGGVRGADDIRSLAELGIDGALVATCLHSGTLTPDQIETLHG